MLFQIYCWLNVLLISDWYTCMWSDNKVRDLIGVKVLYNSLLNITVVAFKVLPLGSYAPLPAPSPPFRIILKMLLWNGLQRCCRITADVNNVIKMPSFQYFLYLQKQKNSLGARSGEQGGCSSTVICLLANNSLTDSALIQCRHSRNGTLKGTQAIIDAT
jgi:hypothetical protein